VLREGAAGGKALRRVDTATMKGVRLAILVGAAALAAAIVIAQAVGAGRPQAPQPLAAAPQPVAPRPPSPEDRNRQAEERLLDERTFSHPVNVPAPDVSVVGPDGKSVKLSSLKGKVVVVNFWATWCPPCIEEMPSMVKLGTELRAAYPDAFRIVAVSGDDTWEAVHSYFRKAFGGAPRALDLVRDPDAQAARAYYCAARGYCPDIKFPETYVVDRGGKIVAMIVGPRDWSSPEARQLLEFLIRG
jgi:thiol-disulfide isomerase/thioredoxin